MRKTAPTSMQNPAIWFHSNFCLNTIIENTINTINVIASCKVLSWTRLNGPPCSWKPTLLAGTWNRYSKNARPQLIKIIAKRPRFCPQLNSLNFKWPYHANVINIFETTSNPIVINPFMILSFAPKIMGLPSKSKIDISKKYIVFKLKECKFFRMVLILLYLNWTRWQ